MQTQNMIYTAIHTEYNNREQENRLLGYVNKWLEKATSIYMLRPFTVAFDYETLKSIGSCAVTCGHIKITFNMKYFNLKPETFGESTVPHELAHAIEFMLYGSSGHGARWKTIMRRIGVDSKYIKAKSTAYQDVTINKPKQTNVRCGIYRLECCKRELEISTIKANRIMTNPAKYKCKCGCTNIKLTLIRKN